MLACLACDTTFPETFEHYDSADLREFAARVQCPDCESESWKFTKQTSFAGGKTRECENIMATCRDCYDDQFFTVAGRTPEDIDALADALVCDSCDSTTVRLSDSTESNLPL